MPHARYKVKCALCKKTFGNDNKGASLQEVPPKLHTEDSIVVQERLQSFLILACEKDLTGLIDLEDVTMDSGDLMGGGTMAPGQTLLVAERGPALRKTFKLNHRKRLNTPCAFYLCLQGHIKPGV